MNIYLGGRQADARCCVHGFEHVRHQGTNLLIDAGDSFRPGTQPRIRILENWETRHCESVAISCITCQNWLKYLSFQG